MSEANKRCGNWQSVISPESIAQLGNRLSEPKVIGENYYWVESRPSEKGKSQIVEYNASGEARDLLAEPYSASSAVHEYGGGVYCIGRGQLYFVNKKDQQIYAVNLHDTQLSTVQVTTMTGSRFADLEYNARDHSILCIQEIHSVSGVDNLISSVDCHNGEVSILQAGDDFYSSPRFNDETGKLVWIGWNHPNMPWDNSCLYMADVVKGGDDVQLKNIQCLLEGEVSVTQPRWSPTNELYCIADINNWWNIYRYNRENKEFEIIAKRTEDMAPPAWQFGSRSYAFTDDTHIIASSIYNGFWQFIYIDIASNQSVQWVSEYCSIDAIVSNQQRILALGAGGTFTTQLIDIQLQNHTPLFTPLLSEVEPIDNRYISSAEPIAFGEDNDKAHAFYYPPANPDYSLAEMEELPPLMVMSHGGPTGMSEASLNLKIQFWTSRGFGVVDVNYRGSSGYGRKYRNQLRGKWGIADVQDCCNAAKFLANRGDIDGDRVVIRGSSAGGYTTLCALTFTNDFAAGCSMYGIGDLETLVMDTHKFEMRYTDNLIASYPEGVEIYRKRSPINYPSQISCPILLLQGLDDKVVPPNQAELMASELAKNNVRHKLVFFENEGHGFRSADAIVKALNEEWQFYGEILGYLD